MAGHAPALTGWRLWWLLALAASFGVWLVRIAT